MEAFAKDFTVDGRGSKPPWGGSNACAWLDGTRRPLHANAEDPAFRRGLRTPARPRSRADLETASRCSLLPTQAWLLGRVFAGRPDKVAERVLQALGTLTKSAAVSVDERSQIEVPAFDVLERQVRKDIL